MLFESTGRGKSKSVELEDVKFHQCVRLSRFENDRTISFIPPDGEFELMSYRFEEDKTQMTVNTYFLSLQTEHSCEASDLGGVSDRETRPLQGGDYGEPIASFYSVS